MIVCELAPSVPGFYVIPRQWKRKQRKGRVKMNSNSEEGARMAVRWALELTEGAITRLEITRSRELTEYPLTFEMASATAASGRW